MADDRDERDERDEDEESEGQQTDKRKKWLLWGAVGAGIAVLLVAVTAVAFVLFGGESTAPEEPDGEEQVDEPPDPPSDRAVYYQLSPSFVATFNVRGRQRHLQADVALMLRDKATIDEVELHMPVVRNRLVMLFSGQVYEDLQTPEGKELLRQQALTEVRDVMEEETGEPAVEQVLFTGFVMQ